MRKTYIKAARSVSFVRRGGIAIALLLLAGGCTTALEFPSLGLDRLGSSRNEAPPEPTKIVLSQRASGLSADIEIETAIRDVVDLARQKRFGEARLLLRTIRSTQERDSEGYQAQPLRPPPSTASMAILALREGDFATFMRIAGRLDKSLGEPVRVDETYVEIIALYRALSGTALPVNAPDKLRRLGGTAQRTAQAALERS